MKEPERLARNAQRLSELHPVFAERIAAVIAELESAGYRPRIQDAWRSPQSQLEAFERGTSTLKFGFHNVTGPSGQPEALAVDLLDDDFPLNSRLDYLLRLAGAARKHSCATGIAWGLPNHLREAIAAAIEAEDWGAQLKIGWDPTHVEPSDVTVAEAQAGKRPTTASAATPATTLTSPPTVIPATTPTLPPTATPVAIPTAATLETPAATPIASPTAALASATPAPVALPSAAESAAPQAQPAAQKRQQRRKRKKARSAATGKAARKPSAKTAKSAKGAKGAKGVKSAKSAGGKRAAKDTRKTPAKPSRKRTAKAGRPKSVGSAHKRAGKRRSTSS